MHPWRDLHDDSLLRGCARRRRYLDVRVGVQLGPVASSAIVRKLILGAGDRTRMDLPRDFKSPLYICKLLILLVFCRLSVKVCMKMCKFCPSYRIQALGT